ncbi:MAG: sugar ABC transporter substrate-binding protein [Spirochaetaceae bacterium]
MKRILSLVLIGCISLSLFAKNDAETTTETAAVAAEPVTLTFASWSIQEKGAQDYFTELKSDFEAANPDIKIEFSGYPYGELKKQVLIMANAGQMPDIIQSARSWYPSFVTGGYVAELDSLLGKEYLDDVYPELLDDMKYEGKTYGIPWKASPFVLFYNKLLFEQAGLDTDVAPKTYEEAMMFAEKLSTLKDADGNSVYAFGQTTGAVPVSGGAVLSMFFSHGGGIVDANGNVDVINDGNKAALLALKDMHDKGYNPEGAKLKDLRNLFAIGRLGMYFDQLWGMTGAYAINPDLKGNVGVANPLSGNGSPAGSTLEAHLILISEDCTEKDAAATFIKFATSPAQMAKYYAITPFLLPRDSQVKAAPAYKTDPGIEPILNYAETIRSVEKHPEMENVFVALTTAAQGVSIGWVTVDEALVNLEKELKTLLK